MPKMTFRLRKPTSFSLRCLRVANSLGNFLQAACVVDWKSIFIFQTLVRMGCVFWKGVEVGREEEML